MITKDRLLTDYDVVHGNAENIQPVMLTADLHFHTGGGGDTTAPAWMALFLAALQKIDVVAITNHNQDGFERAARIRDRISKLTGHHITLQRAAEVTARSHKTGEGRHVIIYKNGNLKKFKVFTPLPELLAIAAEQDAVASLAHPGLGKGMSVTPREVDDLANRNLPFLLEVHNGGAAQIDRWRPEVEKRSHIKLFAALERLIPQTSSNELAKQLAARYGRKGTGGTDNHGLDPGFVLTCAPVGTTIFEAINAGTSVIFARKKTPRPKFLDLAIGTVGSRISSFQMDQRLKAQSAILASI